MGSNSSKQSLEIERNKRLREFEEELVEHNNDNSSLRRGSASHSPPIRDHHFMENDQNSQQRRGSSSISDLLREDFETESELDRVGGEGKNDKEVEDAIAELEETFRTLTPSKIEGNPLRQEESDAYRLMKEFSRSQSCGPLNINAQGQQGQSFHGGGGGETRERRGTPMQGASHNAYRRHRPMGLAHLSRSSGGLGNNSGGDAIDMKGALSAPPGVSNLREPLPQPQWTPPNIDGFDVSKFREANRPEISISVRLPTRGESDEEQRRRSTPNNSTASYTNDELELLRKLEREVY